MKKLIFILFIFTFFGALILAQEASESYERRPFQMTFFFPPFSTNGASNGIIVNDVSLNLFLGVSGGVEAFEAGLFINIDQYYMHGAQLAGFGNIVGGEVRGAQLAGFFDVAGTYVHGFQGSGFVNVTGSDVYGAQASGFVNVAGNKVDGFQGTGFVNVAGGNTTGAQAAGFVNVTGGSLKGFQGAGFVNFAESGNHGVQAAGFGNVIAGGQTHFQGAGFFNVAEEIEGAQTAGFLNVAGKVKGVQLAGFLNVCDSIDGVPLALISVVKQNGYRKLSFNVSEVQYANLSYKMGVKQLYNIYSFGKPFGPGSRWMFGGGFGGEIDLSNKMRLNIEGTMHQELWIAHPASPYFLYIDRLNLYNSLKILFGWSVDEKVDLHVGPTFNVSVAHSNPSFGVMEWNPIPPYSFYNHTSTNYEQTNVRMWVGIQGSISF